MKRRDNPASEREALRDKIIGLGEQSFRKSYFPQLQTQLNRLEQFRYLLNHSRDGILLVDCDSSEVLDANLTASQMFDMDPEALVAMRFDDLFHGDVRAKMQTILNDPGSPTGDAHIVEMSRMGADDRELVFEFTVSIITLQEKRFLVVVARDVTQQKLQEAKLRASLTEKEALLKEIHHRVKNNLQVISSLLHMQAMENKDPAASDALRESQMRVRSMALVHERLYQSADLSGIDFVNYFPGMTRELLRSYGRSDIALTIDVEPIFLSIDYAIPVGLIASELVSNALKHAFPGGRTGDILVSFRRVNGNHARLVVSDNGVGLAPDVKPASFGSMGMTLVRGLTEQLEGTIALDRNGRTCFVVTFPLPPPKPSS
jgi:two-component system, sensor histidine kinase PdtaS